MVVQADGASYALDSSPERTRQALGAIASTGRQALAEMRRMLGVLRSDDGGPGVVPQPGIGQDLIKVLDHTAIAYRRGRHPAGPDASRTAAVLRAVAADIEA